MILRCKLIEFLLCFAVVAAPAPAVAAEAPYSAKVVRILDGDTLEVMPVPVGKPQRIRIAFIDAPESRQDYGSVSKQALATLCFNRVALVMPSQIDRYGRTIASLRCDGVDVASAMVSSGMAWVYVRYSSDAVLMAMQAKAQALRVGLWSASHPPRAPWEFRHQ